MASWLAASHTARKTGSPACLSNLLSSHFPHSMAISEADAKLQTRSQGSGLFCRQDYQAKRGSSGHMPMEYFYTTELAVPMSQMVLLLICTTVALLFGRIKLALLVNYLFALFWGYILNRDVLIGFGESVSYFIYIYIVFGLSVAFLALVGFVVHRDE
jgi:hypothetical protein